MACYDLDRFRDFVFSDSFNEVYDLPDDLKKTLAEDEIELMQFGFRFLRQVMFSEESIAVKSDAFDKRLAKKRERVAAGLTTSEPAPASVPDSPYDHPECGCD